MYLVGVLSWAATMYGIGLAHWSAWFGLAALSLYLGVYLPLFIGLTRVLTHRLRWPLLLAAPIVWTGLELARGHLITGFSMALLAHTQVDWTPLIQIADLAGGYTLSFLMVFTAAGVAIAWRERSKRRVAAFHLAAAALLLFAALGYGSWRLGQQHPENGRSINAALLQEVVDTEFSSDPMIPINTFQRYAKLARAAARKEPQPDVIVWPESVYTADNGWPTWDANSRPPAEWPPEYDFEATLQNARRVFGNRSADLLLGIEPRPMMLVGCDSFHYGAEGAIDRYNSAMMLDSDSQVKAKYDKQHPVMFGEYVPFGDHFPFVYQFTPFGSGLTPGREPVAMTVGEVRLAPSICFESTVPHLIRGQVRALQRRGESPDVLVNLTNDGWFWGSSVLDLQHACAVFRAVELRKPMLVAANTGISAHIDGNGRVLAQSPKRAVDTLFVQAAADGRTSPYLLVGDWPAALCAAICLLAATLGLWPWERVWVAAK